LILITPVTIAGRAFSSSSNLTIRATGTGTTKATSTNNNRLMQANRFFNVLHYQEPLILSTP